MWRNTVLRAEMMPGVDGRVAIALLIFLLHWSLWTFMIFLGTCVFFWMLDRRGYTLRTAVMRIRSFLAGSMRVKWSGYEFTRRHLPGDLPIL